MKVCTDACLFGAWVADKMERKEISPKNILDLGAGTGLLSLMLAQKSSATIEAIEIDADAASQAQENINASPFHEKIGIINADVKDLAAENKYDLIICNPPFYENQLASPDRKKNKAMHDSTLTFSDLAMSLREHLSSNGKAAVLIPHDRVADLEKEITLQQMFIEELLNVSHSPSHPFFRSCMIISFSEKQKEVKEMNIKDDKSEYSSAFRELLKDYYLNF